MRLHATNPMSYFWCLDSKITCCGPFSRWPWGLLLYCVTVSTHTQNSDLGLLSNRTPIARNPRRYAVFID